MNDSIDDSHQSVTQDRVERCRLACAFLIGCLLAVAPSSAFAISEVTLSNPVSPTNFPFGTGGPNAAIDDPFTYNPTQNYSSASFLNAATQKIDIPQTAYGSSPVDTFMSFRNGALNIGTDATNFLVMDVNLNTDQSLDFVDIWGRTDYSGPEEDRHQNLTITFYDGPGGTGSVLGTILDFDGVTAKDGSNTPGSAYGRLDVSSALDSIQREQVQSIEFDHVGTDTFLLFAEVRAASVFGIGPGAQPVLIVDRATGELSLINESVDGTDFTFSAYSIRSPSSNTYLPGRWDSIASTGDADSGGAIDSTDHWFELSAAGSSTDLSESEAPVGDGVTLEMGGRISLGRAYRRDAGEDMLMQVVSSEDLVIDVPVRYEGSYLPGDFDFSEFVDGADLLSWQNAYESTDGADADDDGDSDGRDFLAWQQRFGSSTPSALATASNVPEPSTAGAMLICCICLLVCRASQHQTSRCSLVASYATCVGRNCRSLLVLACALSAIYQAESAVAQTFTPTGNKAIRLEKLVEGLNGPLSGNTPNTRKQFIPIDMSPLGDGRQVILTLAGHVRLLEADGTLAPGAYVDTTNARTPSPNAQDFTQIGATSIEAHPGFSDPNSRGYGKFYTITSEVANSGMPADFSLNLSQGGSYAVDSVVSEWTVDPTVLTTASQLTFTPDTGGVGDTVTVREVLRSQRPGIIHTLADMAFDADENLLITSGDGGGNAFPNSDGSAFGRDRASNSQDPTNIFGSILRIDPLDLPNDTRATGGVNNQYRIPSDNFFAADGDPATKPEFFAYGFRSPYRMTVDIPTNTIFIGDVGEASREEVSIATNGGNYGWGAFEGTRTNNAGLAAGAVNPIGPTFEMYHNLNGQSEAVNVVGGFVYRGSAIPELQGMYVFADTGEDEFTQSTNVLDLYYGDPNTTSASVRDDFFRLQLELPDGLPDRIWSIAEDDSGELFILAGPERIDLFDVGPGETDGSIWRILPAVSQPLNGIAGDVNQDGIVNGDGTGSPESDDVSAFVNGWLSTGHETLFGQFTNGDMNFDEITDFHDWIILKSNHVNASQLSLGEVLAARVPEPSTIHIILLAFIGLALIKIW